MHRTCAAGGVLAGCGTGAAGVPDVAAAAAAAAPPAGLAAAAPISGCGRSRPVSPCSTGLLRMSASRPMTCAQGGMK